MKRVLLVLLVVVGAAPLAAIAGIFLAPLWRWIERTTGIESIGHSGPAGWCFAATYGFVLLLGGAGAAVVRRTSRRSAPARAER